MSDDINVANIKNIGDLFQKLRLANIPEQLYGHYVNLYQNYKAREKGVPLDGLFELTPLCNFDCKMCYVHLSNFQVSQDEILTIDQWKNIMMQAYNAGMVRATLSGGECLVYPGFKELYIFLKNLGVSVGIKTNGFFLTDDIIDLLVQYPVKRVCVSLYGSSEEMYEQVTGFRFFSRVYSNLLSAKKAGLPILICITPNKYLFDDIEAIIRLCKEIDLPYIVNSCIFTPRENTGRENADLSIEQYVELFKKIRVIEGKETITVNEADLPEFSRSEIIKYGVRCGAGKGNFDVTWDGLLLPCLNIRNINVDILNTDFKDAWEQINYSVQHVPIPAECVSCAYDKACLSCIALHSVDGKEAICNKHVCQKTKAFVKAGILSLN